jgi:hypothetical protein
MSRDPRLVLVEGLPGAGKSTTAHLLSLHMARQGRPARWYYEHQEPHPIFHYPDILAAIETGVVKNDVFGKAADRWRDLATSIAASGESAFVESAFFQHALHPMRLMDWSESRTAEYVDGVVKAIEPASPLLVMLRHSDVPQAIATTATWRGDWFMDFLVRTVEQSAYGRARGATGIAAVHEYFIGYRDQVDRLIASAGIETVVCDADVAAKAQALEAIAARLGLASDCAFSTELPLEPFTGKYVAQTGEGIFDIVAIGSDLFVNGIPPTRLIHRRSREFEIAGLPVTLDFIAGADGRMAAINCSGPLPDLARTWARSE